MAVALSSALGAGALLGACASNGEGPGSGSPGGATGQPGQPGQPGTGGGGTAGGPISVPPACFGDAGEAAGDSISVDVVANRLSGVAPLSVFFDASGTVATDLERPFHELGYCWNFGDPSAGDFATTGLSKNRARGPVAGHVFESPGEYEVELYVRDQAGRVAAETVTVSVEDPDEVFAGSNTVCFSPSDFAGCPEGAEQVSTGELEAIKAHIIPGRRLLLRRGESFAPSDVTLNVGGPGHIGAFGEGPPPEVVTSGETFRISSREPKFDDWRITDLSVRGSSTDAVDSHIARVEGKATNLLLLRVQGETISGGVSAPASIILYWNDNDYPGQDIIDGLTLQECEMRTLIGGGGHNFAFIASRRFLFLGNTFNDSTGGEHVMRAEWLDRAVIAHNAMGNAPVPRHVIKMHGPIFTGSGILSGQYTEKVILADNRFSTDGGHDWTVTIGPQNATSDERIRDVLIERNAFTPGSASTTMMLWGSDITVRNNVFLRGESGDCLGAGQRGVEPAPERVHVYNNTAYSENPGGPRCFAFGGSLSEALVKNNLVVGLSGEGTVLDGSAEEEGNILTSAPGFETMPPQNPADVQLTSSSVAVDAGVSVPLWSDYFGEPRPMGSGVDVGAVEAQAEP